MMRAVQYLGIETGSSGMLPKLHQNCIFKDLTSFKHITRFYQIYPSDTVVGLTFPINIHKKSQIFMHKLDVGHSSR